MFSRQASLKRRHGSSLVEAIQLGLDDDFPIPKPTRRSSPSSNSGPAARLTGRSAERAFAALKLWRNSLCETGSYTSLSVASNTTLKAIVRARPTDLEELAAVEDVRKWQVRDFGEQFLAVLDEAEEGGDSESSAPDPDDGTDERPRRRRRRRRRKKQGAADEGEESAAAPPIV